MNLKQYKPIFPVIFKQKVGLLQLLGLAIVSASLAALMPWPFKILADYALAETDTSKLSVFSSSTLVIIGGVFAFILYVFSSALGVASSWLWSKVGQLMVIDLSLQLFDRLQRLSRIYHTKHPVADSLNRLTVDTWCVFSIAQSLLITPVQNIITIVVVSIVAWQLDPNLTILSLIIAPILGISTVLFGGRMKKYSIDLREKQSSLMTFVHRTLGSMPLVAAFNSEKRNTLNYRALSERTVVAAKRNTFFDQVFEMANGLVLGIGLAVVLYVGSTQVVNGTITLGSLLVFVGYLATLQGEAQSLLMTFKNLKTAEASLGRVIEILDVYDSTMDTDESRVLFSSTRSRVPNIVFDNVSFEYETGKPVLKNVDLEIEAGNTVAFVGPSGSGKSTLASLIPRFFDATEGDIRIGEHFIRDISVQSLRDRVSLVLQDPYLLPMTIKENIAYGKPEATQAEIIQAATTANASGFIRRLPNGYDTVLGENGVNLSGGQRQRLSIARALLKNAPILILDEPTSALDNQTESLFMSALNELMKGRTTVIVAHRLSTIRKADKIVVVNQGEISEQGSHDELMALDGLYADMVRIQTIETSTESAGKAKNMASETYQRNDGTDNEAA